MSTYDSLDFFSDFDDVELWEVVHRAKWQRLHYGHRVYRRGQEGNTFHIIAQGEVEVFRDGQRVARLGAGTSNGSSSEGGGRRPASRSAFRARLVAIWYSQARSDARCSKRSRPRQAASSVSCSTSSASCIEPRIR